MAGNREHERNPDGTAVGRVSRVRLFPPLQSSRRGRAGNERAHENGMRLPFEEFKKRYRILDAGVNVKYLGHDNFVNILKPEGYEAMLDTIGQYLGK
jgi:hypothetical protein